MMNMMTCSRNLSKDLKYCYKTKTNKEMLQHDFQKFTNLIIFSSKIKVIKYSFFIFIFHICAKKHLKRKRLVMICVFECFQSHCHILKKSHEFLCVMGAMIIFDENSFIFSIVSYGLVTKSFGARCTFEEVAKKTKCQKMNVNIFITKLRWTISLIFRG
jgi:hypothetical protein